jgi:hypothetical protein
MARGTIDEKPLAASIQQDGLLPSPPTTDIDCLEQNPRQDSRAEGYTVPQQ